MPEIGRRARISSVKLVVSDDEREDTMVRPTLPSTGPSLTGSRSSRKSLCDRPCNSLTIRRRPVYIRALWMCPPPRGLIRVTSCAFCGRENEPDSRFCIDCGKPMNPSAARVGPAYVPQPFGGQPQPASPAGGRRASTGRVVQRRRSADARVRERPSTVRAAANRRASGCRSADTAARSSASGCRSTRRVAPRWSKTPARDGDLRRRGTPRQRAATFAPRRNGRADALLHARSRRSRHRPRRRRHALRRRSFMSPLHARLEAARRRVCASATSARATAPGCSSTSRRSSPTAI